jgi:hypothetical protein
MESLIDATDDRIIKEVPSPPHRPISDDLLYPNKCKFTLQKMRCSWVIWQPAFVQMMIIFINSYRIINYP